MQISIGFSFFLPFYNFSVINCVMESQCCLCKCYNACVSTETPIFCFNSNPKKTFSISHLTLLITLRVILWLLQTSCSIFIEIVCYNHSRVFDACFTISVYNTVILAVMTKSAFLLPNNWMCPILPLIKNT